MRSRQRVTRRPARVSTPALGLSAGAALALVLGFPTGPAAGAASTVVAIPLHPADPGLHLIGASEAGVAVRQSSVGQGEPVFTGALGTELTRRTPPDASIVELPGTTLGVTGSTLTWYRHLQRAGSMPQEAHRMNILTGKDLQDGEIALPGAFNGESWFSDSVLGTSEMRPRRPVRQYHVGPNGIDATDILVPDQAGVTGTGLAADRMSVLWARQVTGAPKPYALDLIDLKTKAMTRLLDSTDKILDVELTADTVVWSQTTAGGGYTIHQQPRAGGAATSYRETDPNADVAHLAAGAAGIGYLVTTPADPAEEWSRAGTKVVVVSGSTARSVELPGNPSGLAAVGNHFLTAVGGDFSGVYQIDGQDVTAVATVPRPPMPPEQFSLSAGTLRYRDLSVFAFAPGNGLWERTVTDGKRPRFSHENMLWPASGPMAFSAARGVVGVPEKTQTWRLTDRGHSTVEVEAAGAPNVSGAYTLIGGKVFRPDGELLFTQPVPVGTARGADDLFGAKLVYVRTTGAGVSTVWLSDAERPQPTALAEVTAPAECEPGGPKVSIWGELVAWTSGCADHVSIRNLRTGTTREVATHGWSSEISLSEGTLTWRKPADVGFQDHVLDLTSPTSVPVPLPGWSSVVSVDDHHAARQVKLDVRSLETQPVMTPLPFRPKYPPRLISRNSPLGFTPDADGERDLWAPEFDLTKPMRSVTLKILDPTGKSTLATIDGTAPDGSVRDLSWNGLTGKGQQLPPGEYRWTLTGRSTDGDGMLIAADGTPAVTGTVEINNS